MENPLKVMAVSTSAERVNDLARAGGTRVELLHTTRGAQTVRRFETEAPDLIMLEIGQRPEQTALLIQAIRERPLGALVPIFIIDPHGESGAHPLATFEGAAEAGADRFFPRGTPAAAIMAAAGEMLHVDLGIDAPPAPMPPSAAPPRPTPTAEAPTQLPQDPLPDSLYASSHDTSPDAIRRKLRQARHEDYFTLLEVRKSADASQIEKSYTKLRGRFSPERLPRPIADRHFAELEELCDALDDAYGVLADEAMRKMYLSALLQR